MTRLNQLLAIEKGVKEQSKKDLTELHRTSQKEDLYDGLSRVYEPLDEEGERFPSESKIVQQRVEEVLDQVGDIQAKLMDVVAAKDLTNCGATSDVTVDGLVIPGVPATHLLWLEKRLEDIHTFVSKLPTLDPAVIWKEDTSQSCMVAAPVQTHKTKKLPRNHVKAEATDKHPAQVEVYLEDKVVGNWTSIRYSGRISLERKNKLLERIRVLQSAVKQGREQANMKEVNKVEIGKTIMDWLFA
jgi:hypothetical protein